MKVFGLSVATTATVADHNSVEIRRATVVTEAVDSQWGPPRFPIGRVDDSGHNDGAGAGY